MSNSRFSIPVFLWALVSLFYVGLCVYYYPSLPDRFATHFNMAGEPNGWMGRHGFFLLEAILELGTTLLLVGIYLKIPSFPEEYVNIPEKEIWFSTPALKMEAFRRTRNVIAFAGIFVNAVFSVCLLMILKHAGVLGGHFLSADSYFAALVLLGSTLMVVGIAFYLRAPKSA